MKVELRFLVPENSSEFSAVIKFKDIDHSDAVHLMGRSKKPLADVGASLEVNSPLAALEIMLMYFSSVSGGDQNQALQVKAELRNVLNRFGTQKFNPDRET